MRAAHIGTSKCGNGARGRRRGVGVWTYQQSLRRFNDPSILSSLPLISAHRDLRGGMEILPVVVNDGQEEISQCDHESINEIGRPFGSSRS